MQRISRPLLVLVLAIACLVNCSSAEIYASSEVLYINPDTGYQVVIEDNEDLLNDEEEKNLLQEMIPITAYGNVAFVSGRGYGQSAASYANDWYYSNFSNNSGTAFVIDMHNRIIQISSGGEVYKTITKGYANTITDNVYKKASQGDYYGCAKEAFSQAFILLEGGRISRPMKHITNLLVAAILAIVINYILARYQRKPVGTLAKKVFLATTTSTLTSKVLDTRVIESITYEEDDDDVGGGGFSGGSFSGGGFSGGGFSGGGGGHSF